MPITSLPTPPSRSDPTNFATRGDAFLGGLPTFATEANLLADQVNASQVAAAASASSASASATAANSTANVSAWVSGTTYAVGANRFSPITFLTYRRKTAGAGTTDPSIDTTNWQLLTGQGDLSSSGTQTINGSLLLAGAGRRYRGDFSNSTLVDRVYFQNDTTNTPTIVGALPNGTSTTSGLALFNNSVPTNAGLMLIQALSSEVTFRSDKSGTGTYLPMTFYTSGSEAMRIDQSGRVGVGVSPSPWVSSSIDVNSLGLNGDGTNFAITNCAYYDGAWKYKNGNAASSFQSNAGMFSFYNAPSGTINTTISFLERFRIDGPNSLVLAPNCNGLGYTSGSGGTVTQATNKSTSVTLNTACGYIQTSNAALASNSTVVFQFYNSLLGQFDVIVINTVGGIANPQSYQVWCGIGTSGMAQICIRNISGGSLSESLQLKFVIIKGSIT